MHLFKILLFVIAGLTAHWLLDRSGDAGVVLGDGSIGYPDYQITALEPFELTGRLLSRRDYSHDRNAELSPMDLAMGWEEMADPDRVAAVEFSQRNRWMFWKARQLPMPRREMEQRIGNIHIIPGNAAVSQALQQLQAGALLTLRGDLVEVRADDGWRWRSSLSRSDTGDGSCELLLLQELRTL